MTPSKWVKQPSEVRELEFDMTNSLASGDAIFSVDAKIYLGTEDVSSALISGSPIISSPKFYLTIQGGIDGNVYRLEMKVPTLAGEVIEDELKIVVKEK